jgi:nicotinate dehydrogenase subunit B
MWSAEGSRREFLKGTGVLVVSFTLAPLMTSCARGGAETRTLAPDHVDAYLAIDARGGVTVYSGKVDLGTGVRTALTQIAAEELDVPLDRVTLIEGDTELTPDQGVTSGSLSIEKGGMQIRQAAATARHALVQRAAQRLGVPSGDLVVENGTVRSRSGGKQATYGELLSGRTFSLKVDAQAPLRDPASYTIVGRSVPRLDIPAKVTGRFTFMQNVRVPGMLHGRVVRPPAIGATLQSVDEASVKSVRDLVKVARLGNFLGVVAESEWGAISAARQLRATWSAWAGLPDESRLWQHVRETAVVKNDVTSDVGDVEQALPRAARRLAATYDFAMHTHGSIGPSCAIAEIKNGTLTCWSASQATHELRKQLATMLSMPERDVRVIYVEGAGCYGRNGHEDAAADAALLARAVGRPVRVQWMRADEHGWDPKGPPTLIDLQAGLDEIGRVLAWSSQFFVPQGGTGDVELLAVGLASLPGQTGLNPGGILNDVAIPYGFANVRTVAHRLATTPLRPAWIPSRSGCGISTIRAAPRC